MFRVNPAHNAFACPVPGCEVDQSGGRLVNEKEAERVQAIFGNWIGLNCYVQQR